MNKPLQIATQNQLVKLTKPQNGLLQLINDATLNQTIITMDDLVDAYCKTVRCNYYSPRSWDDKEYSVRDEYKKQSAIWTYHLRALIKSWFINTIGVLVLKEKLLVIPIIEIED